MRPPLFVPIDWVLIRDTLRDWFDEVSGCETIWSDEGGPQPAYPYATLTIMPGQTDFGTMDEHRIKADGSIAVVGRRDFMLSCQIHIGGEAIADPAADARIRSDAVIASLDLPPFRDALQAANLGVWGRGQPQNADLVVGTEWIKRSQFDVRFATMSLVDIGTWPDLAKPGWFSAVRMTSNLSPLQGGGGLNWTDELLDPNA